MDLDLDPSERREIIRRFNPAGRIWLRLVARFYEYASDLVPTTLNLSWVTDSLAVGGAFRPRDVKRLAEMGVGAVIDVREEACDDERALQQYGIRLLRLPTPDRFALSQEHLRHGVEWALAQIGAGRRVFVHCEHGVGRGPLIGAAVLVASGSSAPEALRQLRAKRWQAAPNDRQLEALLEFEAACRAQTPPAGAAPTPAEPLG